MSVLHEQKTVSIPCVVHEKKGRKLLGSNSLAKIPLKPNPLFLNYSLVRHEV